MNKSVFISCCKWFILIVLVVIVAVNLLFSNLTQPKDYQTINIFISAESCDKSAIKAASTAENCAVYCYSESNSYYSSLLSTNGMLLCDILIVSENYLPTDTIEKEYAPLEDDFLSAYGIYCSDFTFYEKDGVPYALLVYEKDSQTDLLRDKVNFGETDLKYYLIVNSSRPNAAPYSVAQITSDNAFTTLALLLK